MPHMSLNISVHLRPSAVHFPIWDHTSLAVAAPLSVQRVLEIRKQPGLHFDRYVETCKAGSNHVRIKKSQGVELPDQCKILGAADKKFHRCKIGRFESEGTVASRNGNQSIAPSTRQGFKNRVPQDIGVVSVTAEVGPVLPQSLIKHQAGEFVKRLRAQVRIIGGCQGRRSIAQFRERRQQRCRSEHQNGPVSGESVGGLDQMLEGGKRHA